MAAKRAVRDFTVGGDPWPVVEAWAGRQGYRPVEQADGTRTYQKGSGFWAGARRVQVARAGDQVHLEAWVTSNLLARIISLFILPAEITIESGGAKAIIPRRLGRNEVNDLLSAFGQPAIA